jgi:hypothetical protein
MAEAAPADPNEAALGRRAVVRAAVWGAPVVALGIATPLSAASSLDAGAYRLDPWCGVPGSSGPGFFLTAGPTAPLPARTTITVTVSGATTIGEVAVSGGSASVSYLRETSRLIVLSAALPAGATMTISTTLSTAITARWTLRADSTLPDGYAGSGATSESSFTSLSCRA